MKVVPWASAAEWRSVCDGFFVQPVSDDADDEQHTVREGTDPDDGCIDSGSPDSGDQSSASVVLRDPETLHSALSRVRVWRSRCKLPLAVETTYQLVNAVVYADAQLVSENTRRDFIADDAARLMLAMAVTRFVNGFVDEQQTGKIARPVVILAASLGIPEWIVDVRHEATHARLPSLTLLRTAAMECIGWLNQHYWRPQVRNIVQAPRRVSRVIRDLQTAKNAKQHKAQLDALRSLVRSPVTRRHVAAAIVDACMEAASQRLSEKAFEKSWGAWDVAIELATREAGTRKLQSSSGIEEASMSKEILSIPDAMANAFLAAAVEAQTRAASRIQSDWALAFLLRVVQSYDVSLESACRILSEVLRHFPQPPRRLLRHMASHYGDNLPADLRESLKVLLDLHDVVRQHLDETEQVDADVAMEAVQCEQALASEELRSVAVQASQLEESLGLARRADSADSVPAGCSWRRVSDPRLRHCPLGLVPGQWHPPTQLGLVSGDGSTVTDEPITGEVACAQSAWADSDNASAKRSSAEDGRGAVGVEPGDELPVKRPKFIIDESNLFVV